MISATLVGGEVAFPRGRKLRIGLQPDGIVVDSGSIVVLHGDNGCGKSTFLKAISGVFRCFSDEPHRPITSQMAEWKRAGELIEVTPRATRAGEGNGTIRGAYLAQSVRANVFCRTVEDELAFSLEHSALAPSETAARLETSIAEMGALGIDAGKTPHSLSKGQQQVVGIKSLVQPDPDVLFLDEPTAALDEWAIDWLIKKLLHLDETERVKLVFVATQDSRLLDQLSPQPTVKMVKVVGKVTEEPAWSIPDVEEDGHVRGPDLHLRGITSSWGDFEVSLPTMTLSAGQALVLQGRNGSGKSTLLETIAGFKRAKSGELEFADVSVRAGRRACSRIVNYAFQQAEEQITFHRADRELEYPTKRDGWTRNVRPAVEASGINLAVSPWHLSFGQRQLLTYYTLAFSSPVLAIDEPFASLDKAHRRQVAGILQRYLEAGGIVIATASREHEEFLLLPNVITHHLGGECG